MGNTEIRRAVRAMTAMLQNGEWAEHVSKDRDAMALESAITELHNELHATHPLAAAVLQQEAGEPVVDDRYLELARTLEFTRAELDVYRSTFGQRDTGITPSTGAVKLTDEQHTLAHKVKVLAEIALGRGTKLPLHTRRKNLRAAIDELAALATPQVSPPQARVPLTTTKVFVDPDRGYEVQERDGVVLASHALHDLYHALGDLLQHAVWDEDSDRPLFDKACEAAARARAKADGSAA